jgi:transglutaminase-like putative cysteine protease
LHAGAAGAAFARQPMPRIVARLRENAMTATPSATTLLATPLIDSDHPAVQAFARDTVDGAGADPRARALRLYYAVRDRIRYDPYRIDLSPDGMRASRVLAQGYGWCVNKAALFAAAARAAGIPARVGYADVRNHLSTERMRRLMQSDLFRWHGYAEAWLDGAWVKCTPAFNVELCERFALWPLEWDGASDSLYHAYDREGRQHMEYVHQRGAFDEVPLADIARDFETHYPAWIAGFADASFDADVAREPGTANA